MACQRGASPEGRKHVTQFRTRSAGGKLARPISAEVKEVDIRRYGQIKMADSSISMSSSFVCLYCAKSKLSATAARENKSSSLSELESAIIQDTVLSISGRSKEGNIRLYVHRNH